MHSNLYYHQQAFQKILDILITINRQATPRPQPLCFKLILSLWVKVLVLGVNS